MVLQGNMCALMDWTATRCSHATRFPPKDPLELPLTLFMVQFIIYVVCFISNEKSKGLSQLSSSRKWDKCVLLILADFAIMHRRLEWLVELRLCSSSFSFLTQSNSILFRKDVNRRRHCRFLRLSLQVDEPERITRYEYFSVQLIKVFFSQKPTAFDIIHHEMVQC